MKRVTLLIAVFLTLILTLPVSGQMMGNQDSTGGGQVMSNNRTQRGMMMNRQGGMMGNMMHGGMQGMGMMNQNKPMKKYMMLIQKLPNMGAALNLTDQQTKNLMSMQTDFMKKKIDFQADIAKQRIDMQNLLSNEASSSEVRSAMQKIANVKIDMHVNVYEIANKMKGVLNAQQKQTLKGMMTNKGMMNQGMVQGGMMGGSGIQQGGVMDDDVN